MDSRIEELERLAGDWADAEARGDTVFLGENLADDFVGVGPHGFMLTKEEWIERHASGKLKYESFALDEIRVRPYGDAAILTGRETADGRYEDGDIRHEIHEKFRVSLVFVKGPGWSLASAHMSFIADGNEETTS